jgi:hypothetical protein
LAVKIDSDSGRHVKKEDGKQGTSVLDPTEKPEHPLHINRFRQFSDNVKPSPQIHGETPEGMDGSEGTGEANSADPLVGATTGTASGCFASDSIFAGSGSFAGLGATSGITAIGADVTAGGGMGVGSGGTA